MPGLVGLQSVAGFTNSNPQASPETLHGGTVDPRHVSEPHALGHDPIYAILPGEIHGPYGLESSLMGMDVVLSSVAPAGTLVQDPTADKQPVTHGAPWPGGVPSGPDPEGMADRHAQVTAIRGSVDGRGGSLEMDYIPTYQARNANWSEIYAVDPGASLQVPIPQQVQTGSGGFGSRDRVQSQARQNEYGFDAAHMRGRYPTDGLVGNYNWMVPGARPLRKGIPGTAIAPTGVGSPFEGQIMGDGYDTEGAVLNDLPVAYEPAPQPGVRTSYDASVDTGVDFW